MKLNILKPRLTQILHRNTITEKPTWDRISSNKLYNRQWSKVRARFLKEHPLCVKCFSDGLITAANIVDHIKPHKGDTNLFWDESNYQSLCKPCHDMKTAKEDGGFGNRVGG